VVKEAWEYIMRYYGEGYADTVVVEVSFYRKQKDLRTDNDVFFRLADLETENIKIGMMSRNYGRFLENVKISRTSPNSDKRKSQT
jgi:hypothetical protein